MTYIVSSGALNSTPTNQSNVVIDTVSAKTDDEKFNVQDNVSPRCLRDDMPPPIGFFRNKDLRQSIDPKIAADLRPSADGSTVRTSLVAGGG